MRQNRKKKTVKIEYLCNNAKERDKTSYDTYMLNNHTVEFEQLYLTFIFSILKIEGYVMKWLQNKFFVKIKGRLAKVDKELNYILIYDILTNKMLYLNFFLAK